MDGIASADRKRVARARETLASLDDPKRDWTLPRTAPEGAAADVPVVVAGNNSLVIATLRALTPSSPSRTPQPMSPPSRPAPRPPHRRATTRS